MSIEYTKRLIKTTDDLEGAWAFVEAIWDELGDAPKIEIAPFQEWPHSDVSYTISMWPRNRPTTRFRVTVTTSPVPWERRDTPT